MFDSGSFSSVEELLARLREVKEVRSGLGGDEFFTEDGVLKDSLIDERLVKSHKELAELKMAAKQIVPEEELLDLIEEFRETMAEELSLEDRALCSERWWKTERKDFALFTAPTSSEFRRGQEFFYVQKLTLPVGTKIVMVGDLHGSVHSFLRTAQKHISKGWELKKGVHFICLGDYVDRGPYGLELLYALLKLKIANPQHFHLLRGDHELGHINLGSAAKGFITEVASKYPRNSSRLWRRLAFVYSYFPVSLWIRFRDMETGKVGDWWSQFCHGGLEMGFDVTGFLSQEQASFQMLPFLLRTSCSSRLGAEVSEEIAPILKKHALARSPDPSYNGFMWSDFNPSKEVDYMPGRGFLFGPKLTHSVLDAQKIRVIFRGHQHYEEEPGMLWALVKKNGLHALWGKKDAPLDGSCSLKAGGSRLFTLFGASGAGMLFSTDSAVHMEVKGCDWDEWTITHHFTPCK